jgi:arginine exporter protein ArgO
MSVCIPLIIFVPADSLLQVLHLLGHLTVDFDQARVQGFHLGALYISTVFFGSVAICPLQCRSLLSSVLVDRARGAAFDRRVHSTPLRVQ